MSSSRQNDPKSRGRSGAGTPLDTPMMAQYLREKAAHPDAVLLFRMGDFYETFFDDALLLSRETGVALTSRNPNGPDPIPLAGFPWHSAEPHIARLLKGGHRVAICEQVEEPGPGKKLLERRVTEVLSPGTTVGDSLLQAGSNNYLVALRRRDDLVGIAAADISTGELRLGELDASHAKEELSRLSPVEILFVEEDRSLIESWVSEIELIPAPFFSVVDPWRFGRERADKLLKVHLQVASLEPYECEDLDLALGAAGAVLEYAREQKQSDLAHVRTLLRLRPEEGLHLDESTLRSLEILEPLPGGTKEATLLYDLDHTMTAGGARLLRSSLRRPLARPEPIARRQDAVETLLDTALRASLRNHLKGTADLERIVARLHCGRSQPRDLAAIRQTLREAPKLSALVESAPPLAVPPLAAPPMAESRALLESWPRSLLDHLEQALVENVPATLAEGGLFRDEWDPELAEIRKISRDTKSWIAGLQEDERKKTGIPGLKIGYNRVFGYYLEVTQSQLGRVPAHYQRKQTLTGAERFLTPELRDFEQRALAAEEDRSRRERALFETLCSAVRAETDALQKLARGLAELDFLQSLAEAAIRGRYVRPLVTGEATLRIKDGRHPAVERALGRDRFIPNDIELDAEARQLAIITGPNMAGKSTYLRQVGLLVVLAQLGSFVPATKAEIGISDRIFTRVGAHDSLSRGQSTFLVEMIETSRILHHATARSLVLLDEVGRGTSTYDGLAIAWALVEALASPETPRPRTLFATHFHELTSLATPGTGIPGVFNLNVQVKEWGDRVIFVRKVVEGGADKSYGLQVARLAGIPESVLRRGQEVLALLERRTAHVPSAGRGQRSSPTQLSLFAAPEPPFVAELRDLEIDRLTPLDALSLLHRWKKETEPGEGASESAV